MSNNNGRGRGRGRGGHHSQPPPAQQPLQPAIHCPRPAAVIPHNDTQQAPPPPPIFGFRGIHPGDVHYGNRQQTPLPPDYEPWMTQHMHPSLPGYGQNVGYQPAANNQWAYPRGVYHPPQFTNPSYVPYPTVAPEQVLRSQPDYGIASPGAQRELHQVGRSGSMPSQDQTPLRLTAHTPMYQHRQSSRPPPLMVSSQSTLDARSQYRASLGAPSPAQAPFGMAGPSPSEMSFQISASTPGERSGQSLGASEENDLESLPSGIVRSNTNDLPKWLQKRNGKYPAQSFRAQYQSSDQKWHSQDHLDEQLDTLMVRPQPEGGDKGMPSTDEEELAFAKQVYDAIVDFSQFYGSNAGPVTALLDGSAFPSWYVQKRAQDVAATLREYHTDGFPVTDYSNPNVSSKTGEKGKGSEQDDTCEERMQNILDALRYSKQLACDVLMGKESLASALILAPKQKIKAKLQYLQSNQSRAEANKTVKAELDKTKKRKRESVEESQLGQTQLEETELDGAQLEEEPPRTRSGRASRKPRRF